MRIPRITILDRYVAREILFPFLLGVGLLTFALVTGRLVKLTEMVVNHGVNLGDVISLMGLIMPTFLELTFPMAVLLGVLIGFGRMSGDRELTAARACGVSLYRLAVPVLGVAFVVYVISSWFAFVISPWANEQLRQRVFELSQTSSTAGLSEKVFNRDFPGLVVYVDKISAAGDIVHGVLISDVRHPGQENTIIARRGVVLPDKAHHGATLRLYDGSIFGFENKKNTTHVTSFHVYDLSLKPHDDMVAGGPDPQAMSYPVLVKYIRSMRAAGHPDYEAETELASRYTLPFTTIIFAILGIPLGLKPARGGQSERFGVAVALFFLYYALMRTGEGIAQRGRLDPFLAMCIPDIIFAVLAFWLFYRSATDKGDQGRGPGDFLWDFVERYERKREAA